MRSCARLVWAPLLGLTVSALQAQGTAPPAGRKPDHMTNRFENAEALAKRFDDPARDAWQRPDEVLRALRVIAGQSVADIGAGTGYFAVRLARANPTGRVYGVDVEPSMIAYLRARATRDSLANVTAVLASPDSPNLPAAVDLVLIVDTYHHLPNRVDYFRRLQSMLKPGARVAIIDFRPDATMGPRHEFRFSEEKIRSEMEAAGYRQVESHGFLPQQLFLVYTVR
jgi:ubiquinone/menaquinone biosynthesis C-methylase UbiE